MKNYMVPAIELISLENEDILTTSDLKTVGWEDFKDPEKEVTI